MMKGDSKIWSLAALVVMCSVWLLSARRLTLSQVETESSKVQLLKAFKGQHANTRKFAIQINPSVKVKTIEKVRAAQYGANNKNTRTTTTAALTKKTTDETVAFCISVTDCQWSMRDAAAVHGHAIDTVQIKSSRYRHVRYAFVHPTAQACVNDLQRLGYQVLVRDLPFNISDIQSKLFQNKIEENGCCGSMEYMKLWSYSLFKHTMAIHLDTDTILLQPLDDLWDAMLNPMRSNKIQVEPSSLYQPNKSQSIDFMFTRGYLQGSTFLPPNTTNRHEITTKWGVQGGFFVVRPSRRIFQEIVDTILAGKFTFLKGWNRQGYGGYWGAAQIQGLLSYIYRPSSNSMTGAVELNRCIYNNMHDPMYFPTGRHKGQCTTLETSCTNDCRETPIEKIKLAHFTLCRKPWNCDDYDDGVGLCSQVLQLWFETRLSLEQSWNVSIESVDESLWFYNASLGYCRKLARNSKKQNQTGQMYKAHKGSYQRMIFPWDR
jgi:hypothetical protein